MRTALLVVTFLSLSGAAVLLSGSAWAADAPGAPLTARALQTPAAVIVDPHPDKAHPPGLADVRIDSHGSAMNAVLYTAAGAMPHPAVVLFHGFPGNEQNLDLVKRQHEIGAKSLADVLVIETQVATVCAQLPTLRQQLAETQTQLAVYLGQFPAASELAAIDLDSLTLPLEVPVSVPSAFVRQRPDIRAAEAQLHQATAQVGVATANLYPNITLTGQFGSQALHTGDLFSGGTKFWGAGLSLLQPLFHGGTLRAEKRASEAGLDKAAADYQTTVLGAFQNVADSLHALELDAENLAAQSDAEKSAQKSLDLVRIQYKDGAASYLVVLDATRQYQQARIGLIQARAARLADTAALYAALGGGWKGASDASLAASSPDDR